MIVFRVPSGLICLVICFLSQSLQAQNRPNLNSANTPSVANQPHVLRGQPIQLFDGESTDGWMRANGKPSKNWVVQEQLLYRKEKGGDLFHKHWYRDFELSFTWKINKNGNSGVKYRVQKYGNRNLGCEYQLQDDKQKPLSVHSTGSLYALYKPSKKDCQSPLDEWNESKIVVFDNQIEHWLNGELIVSARSGSTDWLNRVAKSKFNKQEFFGQNQEGQIFLQDHGHPVWFRKIELTPLARQNTFQAGMSAQESAFPIWNE